MREVVQIWDEAGLFLTKSGYRRAWKKARQCMSDWENGRKTNERNSFRIVNKYLAKMLAITADPPCASRLKILPRTFPFSQRVCQWVLEQQTSTKSLPPSTRFFWFFCASCAPDQASGWKPPVALEKEKGFAKGLV